MSVAVKNSKLVSASGCMTRKDPGPFTGNQYRNEPCPAIKACLKTRRTNVCSWFQT